MNKQSTGIDPARTEADDDIILLGRHFPYWFVIPFGLAWIVGGMAFILVLAYFGFRF